MFSRMLAPVAAGCLILCCCQVLAEERGNATAINFARDIRPLLSDRCFLCHGPDAGQRATDLRLDDQDSAHELAIEPGNAQASELLRRITSSDPDELMPPPDSNLRLSPGEIDLLRRWIDEGGAYEQHWAFVSPHLPPIPQVQQTTWPRSDLDRFVLADLEQRQWGPSPPADPATLIRRVTLDLTGLPPTLEEIDDFLSDYANLPDAAYERLVDRLLSSQRYGERMAVDWLDVARYADTYGYQADRYRAMWPWRDWVVKSFNQNMPYDDFITNQIAGDLLPSATSDQILATAFNRNHRQTNEGGSVEEEYRSEYVADRVNTFGAAFLGLTLECCRCHDHKYDPITQQEYYQFSAFFDNIDESGLYSHFTEATPTPTLVLASDSQRQELSALDTQIAQAEQQLAEWHPEPAEFDAWRATLQTTSSDVASLPTPQQATSAEALSEQVASGTAEASPGSLAALLQHSLTESLVGDYSLDNLDAGKLLNRVDQQWSGETMEGPELIAGQIDQGLQLSGENNVSLKTGSDFTRDQPFTIALWLKAPERFERAVVFHRSQAWTDSGSRGYELLIEDGKLSAGVIHFWPGNALRVVGADDLPLNRWVHVAVRYDGSSRAEGLSLFVNGQRITTEVVRDCLTKHIIGGDGVDGARAFDLSFGQRFRDRGFKGGAIDEIKVYTRHLCDLELRAIPVYDASPESLADVLQDIAPETLLDYYAHRHPRRIELAAALQLLRQNRSKLSDPVPEIMVMREQPTPRATHLLLRGAYDAPGELVERQLPKSVFPTQLPPEPSRLDLARWLIDPEHPLTARVAVNRFWQSFFGIGLVSTPEDFGLQGASPTHPELLDWLAVEFIESGWHVKRLMKTIVMSATYRQGSDPIPLLIEQDPENRMLARGPSGRLSAEMIRDTALAASGLLVETLGGAAVKPYQPPGLWEEKSGEVYQRDVDAGSHRRSLYTYWKRTSPPPAMMTLDASNREVCVVRRQVTMTPLQTLVLLNDPQYVEAARGLAERAMRVAADDAGRATFIFRSLTARTPSAAELKILISMAAEQKGILAADVAGRDQWLAIGDHRPAEGVDHAELAAWSVVASGLMSFDETVMKR